MSVKPLITLVALSLSLSACALTSSDKEAAAVVSKQPVLAKASTNSAATKQCADDGFCALPGLKKFQKVK